MPILSQQYPRYVGHGPSPTPKVFNHWDSTKHNLGFAEIEEFGTMLAAIIRTLNQPAVRHRQSHFSISIFYCPS